MTGGDPKALVQGLWDFCDVLRDDGLSYGDYLEQFTYPLFLKMADEQHDLLSGEQVVPIEHDWQSLLARSGADLEAQYSEALAALGAGDDMLGWSSARLATASRPRPDADGHNFRPSRADQAALLRLALSTAK